MNTVDNTITDSNNYKLNRFWKSVLILLFGLGIFSLFMIYQELNSVRNWIESNQASGLGYFCRTGFLIKAQGYKTFVFLEWLTGAIISLAILRKNNWEFSSSNLENALLLSPLILFCLGLFFPIRLY